jgi:membrane protease YdiL (CAAX protease family)
MRITDESPQLPTSPPPAGMPPATAADRWAVAIGLLLPTMVTWLYFIALDGAPAGLQQVVYAIGKSVQFALPVVWVAGVQRQKLRWITPTARGHLAGVGFGLAVALAMMGLYALVLKPLGLFEHPGTAVREKVASFGVTSLPLFIALAMFYALVHSLLEEYYWRWFIFGQLERQTKLSAAIAISSIGFAAHHVLVLAHYFGWTSPLTWLLTACIAIGGAVWAWLYRHSDSLLAPWVSHAIVDAAIFAVGYDVIRGVGPPA